jgi:hypothetical protein
MQSFRFVSILPSKNDEWKNGILAAAGHREWQSGDEKMSTFMLVATLWCSAGVPVAGAEAPPPASAASAPAPAASAGNPAPAEPPAKKGLYFGCLRDRILGRPASPPAPAAEAKAKQPAAVATPTIVQTKAEQPQPAKSDKTPDAASATNAKPGYWSQFQGDRKKIGWTGN